jgi:enamine deaminase RidA (YjgF/YER057c/UK114 family)
MQLRCFSPTPVRAGRHGGIAWRASADLLFGTLHIALPPSGECAQAVREGYAELFRLLTASGKRHLVRIWNYVPRVTHINDAGMEVYRDFNLGRSLAFDESGYDTRHMPAATGIGCEGAHIAVAFLASTEAGLNFENPRQISAYRYPEVHGPRPPSFARATAWPHGQPQWLIISGTASIIGHQTVHVDDAAAQARTAMANVRLLLAARGARFDDIDLLTLYVRHARDVAPLARLVAQQLAPQARMLVTQADICRNDLLVEMEALARVG